VSYCSSKAAVTYFGEALHFELKGKVEVMAWDCGGVYTKANPFKDG
jgi:short-subunit dehydrogenase